MFQCSFCIQLVRRLILDFLMPQGLLTLLVAVDALSKVSNTDSWDKQVHLQYMTSHTILRFSRKLDTCISLNFMCSAYEVDYLYVMIG